MIPLVYRNLLKKESIKKPIMELDLHDFDAKHLSAGIYLAIIFIDNDDKCRVIHSHKGVLPNEFDWRMYENQQCFNVVQMGTMVKMILENAGIIPISEKLEVIVPIMK